MVRVNMLLCTNITPGSAGLLYEYGNVGSVFFIHISVYQRNNGWTV